MRRFGFFLVAGAAGFLVDAAVLALLLAMTPIGPLPARLLSIAVALAATWMINRNLAFSPSGRGVAREGARYGGVGIVTGIVNYVTYSALLLAVPSTPPLLALAVGSAVALLFSFLGYSRLVFDR